MSEDHQHARDDHTVRACTGHTISCAIAVVIGQRYCHCYYGFKLLLLLFRIVSPFVLRPTHVVAIIIIIIVFVLSDVLVGTSIRVYRAPSITAVMVTAIVRDSDEVGRHFLSDYNEHALSALDVGTQRRWLFSP